MRKKRFSKVIAMMMIGAMGMSMTGCGESKSASTNTPAETTKPEENKEEASATTARERASAVTVKEEASAATDHADHSQRAARESRSQEREEVSEATEETPADSRTPERRASTRRISTISVTRTRAESTR